jgi:hypothetical protein
VLGEHEATSSRQLARTRKAIREEVERQLRVDHGLTNAEVDRCFECVTEDAGPLDLQNLLPRIPCAGKLRLIVPVEGCRNGSRERDQSVERLLRQS